jgi:hypothetical protein
MKIAERKVLVRDLVDAFQDNGTGGVVGLDGKLDIRPPYQREFVYGDAQRAAVISTVWRGFPLNVMYWADRGDGTYEVMDGQQRTISLGQYVSGDFSYDFGNGPKFFYNLTQDEKHSLFNYELSVYVCQGTDSEKLDWFKTINIAGEKLSDQELRNAVYHGPWLADAKKWFSRVSGPADAVSGDYVNVKTIRQELLELALDWIILRDGLASVDDYMAKHQLDPNATDLWTYFQNVIQWAKSTFPVKRRELTSVNWGKLYQEHGKSFPDGKLLEQRVAALMADEDVQKKSGIYAYVLDGDERHLNIRAFSPNQKREAFERQGGLCANRTKCRTPANQDGTKKFDISAMDADHIIPWSKGGHTTPENCQMLCIACNRQKSDT